MYTEGEMQTAQADIEMALHYACRKHPSWHDKTLSEMLCILMEEVGEAAQALNDRNLALCREELSHAGAVIMRMLMELKRHKGVL